MDTARSWAFVPAVVVATVLTLNAILLPVCAANQLQQQTAVPFCDSCGITIVESIPENLDFAEGSPSHPSTYESWMDLISRANDSIDILSYYWTLNGIDAGRDDPSAWQGETILQSLLSALTERNIKVRIVNNYQSTLDSNLVELIAAGAEVRMIDFPALINAGILHSKAWVVDRTHAYIGSANMDWRSLTQVKELGASITECPCLVTDIQKLFEVYWYLGVPGTPIPDPWPADFSTTYNIETPMKVYLNSTPSMVYVTSEPPELCAEGRSNDLDAILDIFDKAKEYINIAVMTYAPQLIYVRPQLFWPVLDDAMKRVTLEKGIKVRFLVSKWNHTHPDQYKWLRSLAAVNGAMSGDIQVNLFEVPANEAQAQIPYSRVNHDKFIVTDNAVYIGNSNWSGDYFTATAGVALIINQTETDQPRRPADDRHELKLEALVQQQVLDIFNRDWFSEYSRPISDYADW